MLGLFCLLFYKPKNTRERHIGQCAKLGMLAEPASAGGGGQETAQKSGELARRRQRLVPFGPQALEQLRLLGAQNTLGHWWERERRFTEATRTVAAIAGERLAEIFEEPAGETAFGLSVLEHGMDAGNVASFTIEEAGDKALAQFVQIGFSRGPTISLAESGKLKLDVPLFFKVVQGRADPFTRLLEGSGHFRHVEREPDLARAGLPEDLAQEGGTRRVVPREDFA